MRKNFAFTMAEILIAIVIIAVVASLTVPSVISNNQKQNMEVLLKKTYVELEQNLQVYATSYPRGLFRSSLSLGSFSEDDPTNPGSYILKSKRTVDNSSCKFLKDYYLATTDDDKYCGNSAQPCFASNYTSMSGDVDNFTCNDGCSATLKSGVAICIVPADVAHSGGSKDGEYVEPSTDNTPASVYIDLNGPKKPNIGGRDMFNFKIYNDYSIDEIDPSIARSSGSSEEREALFNSSCKSSAFGTGCFNKVISDNWKIKY